MRTSKLGITIPRSGPVCLEGLDCRPLDLYNVQYYDGVEKSRLSRGSGSISSRTALSSVEAPVAITARLSRWHALGDKRCNAGFASMHYACMHACSQGRSS